MKKKAYIAPNMRTFTLELHDMIAASIGGTNIDGLESGGDANEGDGAGSRTHTIWDDDEY